jgi:two-component system response regulator CssR
MYQVYLVEPDNALNHVLSLYLQKEGWTPTSFYSGEKAYQYIDKCPHLWIVDSSIPDIDGYQILAAVKEKYPDLPVLMISERNSCTDRVIALEIGCDDYLPKPFLPKELVIRARNILVRKFAKATALATGITAYDIHPYLIEEMARTVRQGKEMINLTAKEFDLLLLFAKNPFRAFSRDQILQYVWDDERFGSDRSVDDLVRRLRRKLEFLRIESIYGYGYRLLPNPIISSDHQQQATGPQTARINYS